MQRNQLNIGSLHRGNSFNTNGPAWVKRRMQWEAPSTLLAVHNILLVLDRNWHNVLCNKSLHIKTYRHIQKNGMSESWKSRYSDSGKNAFVNRELKIQRTSLHAWSYTQGGPS